MTGILFFSANHYFLWGGSEELWFQACKHFIENHYRVGIFRKRWEPEHSSILSLKKTDNLSFLRPAEKLTKIQRITNRLIPHTRRRNITERNYEKILKWDPSLVVISQGDNRQGIELMKYLADRNLKYVTISQAVSESMWPSAEQIEGMELGLEKSEMNYFVSDANRHVTELQIGGKIKKSKIVYNPFNVDFNTDISYPGTNTLNLACVARYEFNAKGQDVLLETLSEKKWQERDLHVNFYGSGQHQVLLQKLIKYFGIKNAFIKGHCNTLDIWVNNHALILPSRYEGLPLALVEAMLCGRFGIVTNVSGNTEVVQDGINGFVAYAPKPEYLDEAMERAWNRREDWKAIGNSAKQHIRSLVPSNPGMEFYKELQKFI